MANLPPTPIPLLTSGPLKPKPIAKPKPIGTRRTAAPPQKPKRAPHDLLADSPIPLITKVPPNGTLAPPLVAAPAPHDPAGAHPASASTPPPTAGSRVTAMQQFLRSKGYDIAVDGIQGPLTTAAARDWRTSRNPHSWNAAHQGHGVVAAASTPPAAPTDTAPAPAAVPPKKPAGRTVDTAATAPAAAGPSLAEQTKAIVDSILGPLMANVKTAEEARAHAGQQQIGGYTTNAIDQLKGLDFASPYAGAASGANAVNDAELALLKGQGGDLAAQVGAKLASAGVDGTGVVGKINADTAGASGANYTGGGATVQQLLSEGANAAAYGKKLPGIETLAGQQDTRGLQGQVSADTAKQLGDITAQAPQLIQSTLASLKTAAAQDKSLKIQAILASGYDPATGTLTPAAQKALAGLVGTDPAALSGGSSTTAGKVATATAGAAKISPGVSKILGYAATADGTPILTKDGKIVPVSKTGQQGAPKLPSAGDLNKFVDTWFDGKKTTKRVQVTNPDGSPVTDANGAPIFRTVDGDPQGRLDYGQAYKRLRALNVPDGQARQLLNTRYQRGQRGRAWLTNEEQAALKNARLSPKAHRYKSVAFLDAEQVAALKQAHKLPSGELIQGKYVIDEGY